ncbi:MAG: glycosyltransferase [Opitutaceae bacterium]|nr:glycosyltransferase [Opitutaceae bacterium]
MCAAPLFSVILVCHNPGSRLQPALESIWGQRWLEPELAVIDRGSNDGTLVMLESNRQRFARLEVAPERNVYAALNDAITAATGEWVLVLGGRDRLVGEMVLSETGNWMKRTEAGVVAGESADDDGRIQKLHSRVNAAARNFTPPSATFYRRSVFAENGGFDATLNTMGDYEFNIRLWKGRVRFKPVPLRIAACAAREPYDWRACREEIHVRHRYFSVVRSLPWDLVSALRCLMMRRRSRH